MTNIEIKSDTRLWGERVIRHIEEINEIKSAEKTGLSYQVIDPGAVQKAEEEFDFSLLERLQRNFGPFAYDVMNVLYGGRDSEKDRKKAEKDMQKVFLGSPWTSPMYQEMFTLGEDERGSDSPDAREQAAAKFRFLLGSHDAQIPTVGVIFSEEVLVANALRQLK